jgi:hypothetical protein
MSKVESELNISYEGKAFEGTENDPDFKPLDIKLTNKGNGLELNSLGVSIGNLAMNLNTEEGKEEFSAEYSLNGVGIGLALDKENLAIKPKMDVMALLFGPQIEAAVKKWSEELGEGIEASVKASLPFEGTFLIPLQQPLSMRVDKMNFNPEFSFKIITNAANGIGVDVGASASIESDYADGSDGDEFSTTTGTVKTHMKVIVFGEEIGLETEATSTQKGTYLEIHEMRNKLLGICAKEAYKRVQSQFAGNDSADSESLATLFNSTVESTWNEGVSLIKVKSDVNVEELNFDNSLEYVNKGGYRIEKNVDIINKVIQKDETSKMVHEAIVFTNIDEISGQYEAKSGNWNTIISLSKNGNVINGEYDGGSLSGNLNNQIITGLWYEEGESGGNGDFVLQVQEKGNRLYGEWIDENNQKMDWVLEKL